MKHFCTVSDYNYLNRGLSLLESLEVNSSDDFILHYLCIDERAEQVITELNNPKIVPYLIKNVGLDSIPDKGDSKFSAYSYYCFSLPSRFCEYLLNERKIESILYIDSDILFFNDPKIIYEEMGDKSIGIIPHHHNNVGDYVGGYNVGIVFFKNDEYGRNCLSFWVDCLVNPNNKYRKSHGTCGDQKYLELFEVLYPGRVKVLKDKVGYWAPWNFHVYAPWNFNVYNVTNNIENDIKYIHNGKSLDLLFVHYSKFKLKDNGKRYTPTDNKYSEGFMSNKCYKLVYDIYFNKLVDISRKYNLIRV